MVASHRRSSTLHAIQGVPRERQNDNWRAQSTRTSFSSSLPQANDDTMPSWRRQRAHSIQEDAHALSSRFGRMNVTPSSTLPAPVPQSCRQAVAMPPPPQTSARRGSRADRVENWRTKVPSASSTSSSASGRSSLDSAALSKSLSTGRRQSNDSQSSTDASSGDSHASSVPEMLPPMRVTMETGPIEVLPPLRFSMDPPVKGRSAWRFVLPSPKKNASGSSDNEDEEADDLPHWLNISPDELIVRMGSSMQRPISPSAVSLNSLSEDEGALDALSRGTPPLIDQNEDGFSSGSEVSSQASSPELRSCALPPFSYDDDEGLSLKTPLANQQHFAMPSSLSAAAPLPSSLPIPAFLRR